MAPDDLSEGKQSEAPVVRPFGYVEDEAVVRRIGDRKLYLGNVHAANPERHDHEFHAVLSVTDEEHPLTTHHRPLVDGYDAEWSSFEGALDTARQLYRTDRPTLIHCKAGISRSSTVVAATLAIEESRSLADSFAVVRQARPHAVSHPRLRELAVVYLAARR
ncbi:phosphatase [Haloprofundus marisrubri]|uniref:Phosphatase n=1 Tax=Haloprofundus marisrubri TaxID=1514971 RepID=A0A0W1RG36_9EURY|nr:dual specificity protein phosphatase [Haloprofundus marisrubri]KTG11620.1 phosphatase [Haloprofundus marisrubri]